MLYPKDLIARQVAEKAEEVLAALRAIDPEHFFSEGRVYGGGLHKMEPAEMMRLPADEVARVLGISPFPTAQPVLTWTTKTSPPTPNCATTAGELAAAPVDRLRYGVRLRAHLSPRAVPGPGGRRRAGWP